MNNNCTYYTVSFNPPENGFYYGYSNQKYHHKDEALNKIISIFKYASKQDIIKLYAVFHHNNNVPYTVNRYLSMLAQNEHIKQLEKTRKEIIEKNIEIQKEKFKQKKEKKIVKSTFYLSICIIY